VVYCGCLENSWVNSPGSSNPPLSVSEEAAVPLLLYADAFHYMWGKEASGVYPGFKLGQQ